MTETVVGLEEAAQKETSEATLRGGRRRYLEWWLNDLPPVHGLLRFTIYAGLFLLSLDFRLSPFRAIQYCEATSPELFRTYGLIDLLGIPYIDPEIVRAIIFATAAPGSWLRLDS
jgi:hypothetical protein